MKDLFFFSKSQRIGICILLVIILACILIIKFAPKVATDGENSDAFEQEVANFRNSLKDKEKDKTSVATEKTNIEIEYFKFDPNTLDSASFVSLGLKPYIAHNICKYREKGGKFRTANDFGKIYGISESQFEMLKPYIAIKETNTEKQYQKPDTAQTKQEARKDKLYVKYEKREKLPAGYLIKINTADTTELKLLPGIGSYYAKKIVYKRNKLGGFYSENQLLEVLDNEQLGKIKPYLEFDLNAIRKIKVNTASVERLMSHPYINFYIAKSIYEKRKAKKKLTSTSDLQGLPDIDDTTLQKIAPYLSFE